MTKDKFRPILNESIAPIQFSLEGKTTDINQILEILHLQRTGPKPLINSDMIAHTNNIIKHVATPPKSPLTSPNSPSSLQSAGVETSSRWTGYFNAAKQAATSASNILASAGITNAIISASSVMGNIANVVRDYIPAQNPAKPQIKINDDFVMVEDSQRSIKPDLSTLQGQQSADRNLSSNEPLSPKSQIFSNSEFPSLKPVSPPPPNPRLSGEGPFESLIKPSQVSLIKKELNKVKSAMTSHVSDQSAEKSDARSASANQTISLRQR